MSISPSSTPTRNDSPENHYVGELSSTVSALSMRGKIEVAEFSDSDIANDSEEIGKITDNELREEDDKLNESADESKIHKNGEKSEQSETLDPSVVSRFNPTSSNVVCCEREDNKINLCLVAMKRGEVR
jgi:hypothetical protein